MAEITVPVRARLVARFRSTVVLLLSSAAESLHLTLSTLDDDPAALAEARLHHARLVELGAVLDQVGWTEGRHLEDVQVGSTWDVLHDAVLGSLLDAGEVLAGDIGEEPDSVQERAEDVLALDRLLKRIDRAL